MHTIEEANRLWCPMVRIARHEVTEQRQLVNAQTSLELVNEQHHIVGGVNHDALGGSKRMAADHQPLASCLCIADKCAMWRWDGKIGLPERRTPETFWPEEDEPKVEPARVMKLRGVVQDVPDSAVWVPLSSNGTESGYWQEPQALVDAEYEAELAKVRATMRGYCGLAGSAVR